MKEFLKKARRAERARDYLTAGDFYSMAGEPLKALAAYRAGNLHEPAARLAAEIGDYAAAAEAHSRSGNLRAAGEMWLKAEQPDKAWRMYKRAGDHRTAAEILQKMSKPLEAAAAYEQGGLLEPAARLYASHERPADAIRLLEKLIADTRADTLHLEPAERAQRVRRFAEVCGKLYMKVGNVAAAAPLLEQAGRLEEAARAYRESGNRSRAVEVLMKAGREQEAAGLLEGAADSAVDPRLMAELMLKRGEHRWAAEAFERAGDLGMAAECFERAGLTIRAAETARAGRDLLGAARLYRQAGDFRKAAELYAEARAPGEAAECLTKAGDVAAAAEAHLAAGEFLKAARLLFGRGELDRCIEVLQKIPRDADDAEDGAVLLGRIFEEKSLFSLAADCYRRALGRRGAEPETLPIVYRLGRVLEKSGRPEEARSLYEQIAAVDFRFEDVAARVAALPCAPGGAAGGSAGGAVALRPLDEKYEKVAALGRERGGMVFLARERAGGREVRVRRLGFDPVKDAAKAVRLLHEAERLRALRHPAIPPLLDSGVDANGFYYVYEHCEGRTLREILDEGELPDFGTIVSLLLRLAEALDHAHGHGVLCRNLRPENVVISPQRDIRVLDFGLAIRLSEPVPGAGPDPALRYAPPELLLRERLDARSDLYCLGLLGLEACVGPLRGATPASAVGEPPGFPDPAPRPVPALVRRVVERCLERDRNRRYPAARDLLAELQGGQLLPGAIIAGRYEVLREAGSGGMGKVYEARDLVLEERVALKTVSGPMDDIAQRRFLNEIKLARKITHPNIVRVFTFEQWREQRFIVMEYIDGVALEPWLNRRGVVPVEEAARLGCALATGLGRAHDLGIVHRDIKPANILIDASGSPRILDFGIARAADSGVTQAGMTIGSPRYMSPEQVEGRSVDARSDLYSLGLVLYLVFTGREAFSGPDTRSILAQQVQAMPAPARSLRADLPLEIERLLQRLLAKDPAERPASAAEVSAALERFAAVPA